jgi:hypothetical protein
MDSELIESGNPETPEPAMEDTITAAWKEISGRNTIGAEKPAVDTSASEPLPSDDVVEVPDESAGVVPVEGESGDKSVVVEKPAGEVKRAPSSWTAAGKAEFAKSSQVVQDEVLRREADFHAGLDTYKTMAQKGQSFEQTVAPFMATIQSLGATPEQALTQLFTADHQLRYGSPESKTQMAIKIFKDYGIDPNLVFAAYQNGEPVPTAPNQEYQALQQKVTALETERQQERQGQQAREAASLNSEIADFSKGKEHFETVREDMAALLQTGRATTLQDAYDKAVRINPVTFAAEQAKQLAMQNADKAKKAADAKRSASVNITSRGVIAPKAAVGTFEETIRSEAERLGLI